MKKTNLKQKIARGIVTAGIGLVSLVGGCTEEELIGSRVLSGMAVAHPDIIADPQKAAIASGLYAGTGAAVDLQASRNSATNVNIYNNNAGEQEMRNKFTIITNIQGKKVIIDNWEYETFVREHPEDYVDGYEAELHGNGRWQLVHTTGKMKNR